MRTMNDLSLHFLQDVYDAERRSQKSIQKMIRNASDDALKQLLGRHRDQTDEQVLRLEQVFELVTGKRPRGKTCRAMVGLLQEVDEAIAEGEKGPVLDAALIACAQAIDHYEIARYGAMIAFALQTGRDDVAALLRQTLDEEKAADAELSKLADGSVNPHAEAVEGPDDEAEEMPAPKKPGRRAAAKPEAKAAAPAKAAPAKSGPAKSSPAKSGPAKSGAAKSAVEEAAEPPAKPAPGRKAAAKPASASRGRKTAAAAPPAAEKPAARRTARK